MPQRALTRDQESSSPSPPLCLCKVCLRHVAVILCSWLQIATLLFLLQTNEIGTADPEHPGPLMQRGKGERWPGLSLWLKMPQKGYSYIQSLGRIFVCLLLQKTHLSFRPFRPLLCELAMATTGNGFKARRVRVPKRGPSSEKSRCEVLLMGRAGAGHPDRTGQAG